MLLAANPAPAGDQDVENDFASIEERLPLCESCHSKQSIDANPTYPILSGQEMYYLYVQLEDFKAGRRENEQMSPLVKDIPQQELRTLAEYFAAQRWPEIAVSVDQALTRRAKSAASSGQCAACHLGNYRGNSRVPRLAGQSPEYLEKTMCDFKTGARANAPSKNSLLKSYSDEEISALARYLGAME